MTNTKITQRIVKEVGRILHSLVFCIGIITIIRFCDSNYPKPYAIASVIFSVLVGTWFIATYVAIPFMQGLRGIGNQERIEHQPAP